MRLEAWLGEWRELEKEARKQRAKGKYNQCTWLSVYSEHILIMFFEKKKMTLFSYSLWLMHLGTLMCSCSTSKLSPVSAVISLQMTSFLSHSERGRVKAITEKQNWYNWVKLTKAYSVEIPFCDSIIPLLFKPLEVSFLKMLMEMLLLLELILTLRGNI